MKSRKIYALTLAVGAAIFFLSNAGGPGTQFSRQVTGAPGSLSQGAGQPGTCGNAGCHNAGAFSPSLTIELLDGGTPVEKYDPEKSYTLRIKNTPGNGSPARFGFQAVALDADNAQAGAWGDLGTGKQKVDLGGRSYAEHTAPSMSGTFEMEWIAPAIGTGDVTFYSASNAVNNNGNSTGDGTAASTLTLTENPVSSTFELGRELTSMNVLPNPVGERLNLQVNSRNAGSFRLRIIDVTGAVVRLESLQLHAGVNRNEFDVAALPAGLYVLQLFGDGHVAASQMLKR